MLQKIKVMIVDDNQYARDSLREFLNQQEETAVCSCAVHPLEALDMVHQTLPDIVLMDIIMPHMDGFGFMERLYALNLPRKMDIIVLSALGRPDFVARAMEMGASYFMAKPFDYNELYRRITEISGRQPAAYAGWSLPQMRAQGKSMDERIATIFLTIGIPAHIKGYQFLREAVKMVVENQDIINRITKELYPGIAARFDSTPSKVERAIRHAIEVAWARGRIESINRIFGVGVYTLNEKPTNGEFIALIADKLVLEKSA